MANAKATRKEAKALLAVAKEALRHLMRLDRPSTPGALAAHEKIMLRLSEVIDRADPPKSDLANLSSIRLTMTNPSADEILEILEERAKVNEEDLGVLVEFKEGMRRTKQRVYVRLGFNPVLLRRLRLILLTTNTVERNKVFTRLAAEITTKGLSTNPMEVLARMGL